MAYVFNKINEALGEQDANKTDIFGAQQQQQPGAQSTQGTSGGDVKTSTEGQIQDVKAANPNAPSSQMQMPGRATMSIAKKKGSTTQLPGFLTQAQQSLAGAQQGLKDEAQKYVQGYQQKSYGLDEGAIKGAVEGNQDAYSQVAQRLANRQAPQVEQFKPETQTQLQDIEALKSDAGIKQMLGRQAGGQYSGGESALDLAIMRRNPQFNLLREQLLQGQGQLQSEAQKQAQERTAEAAKIAAERYGQSTADIESQLGQQAQGIRSVAEQRAAAENEARKKLAAESSPYVEQQGREVLSQLQKEFAADPRMAGMFDESLLPSDKVMAGDTPDVYTMKSRLGEYYKPGEQAKAEQFFEQPETEKFNRIMGLMGKGGEMITPQERSAQQGFDVQKLRQDLVGAAQAKRGTLDQKTNESITAAQNTLAKKAEEINSGRGQAFLKEQSWKDAEDSIKQIQKKYPGVDINKAMKQAGVSPVDYAKSQKASAYDLMTDKEVSQFKELYKQLGQAVPPELSKAGKGAGKGSKFDSSKFIAALESAVAPQYRSQAQSKGLEDKRAADMKKIEEQQAIPYGGVDKMKEAQKYKRGGR